MKLFAPLVIASANALQCNVCEETTVQMLSSDFSSTEASLGHLDQINGCFNGNTNGGIQATTCEGTCYALFFAYKG